MKITQNEVTVVADSGEPGRSSRWRGRHRQHAKACALPSIVAALFALLSATAFAQNADSIAEREVQRRRSGIPAGEAELARGKSAMHSRNYTVAYQEFKTAIAHLPDAVVSGRAHDEAADGVCKSGTVLAEARIAQGDYPGAEAILNEILTRYDPNCRHAQELLSHMRQPGYFNKSVYAGFINKVEEVKRLLAEADGFYQSGQYDKAMKRYDQVLTLDPYNTAARRGQERISNTKYQYGEEAYNETRARDLWKVEEAWQQPVRKYGAVGPVADNKGRGGEVRGTAQMTNKMNGIIIPHIEFRDTTMPFRTTVYLNFTNDLQKRLADAGMQPAIKTESNMLAQTVVGFLPIALFLLVLYFLFRQQIRMAGKGALNFGKSKARMLARDKNK